MEAGVDDGPALRAIDEEGRPYGSPEWIARDPGAEATALRVAAIERKAAQRKRELERRWHTIYLLYDARDRLLYVGISANGPGRFPQHAKDKAWWRKVVRCEFEHVKGRTAAEARELELIEERRPQWNVRGKPKQEDPDVRAHQLVSALLRTASCGHRAVTIADRCGLTLEQTEKALYDMGARKRRGAWFRG